LPADENCSVFAQLKSKPCRHTNLHYLWSDFKSPVLFQQWRVMGETLMCGKVGLWTRSLLLWSSFMKCNTHLTGRDLEYGF